MQSLLQRLARFSLPRGALLDGQQTIVCRALLGDAGASPAAASGVQAGLNTMLRQLPHLTGSALAACTDICHFGSLSCRRFTTAHSALHFGLTKQTDRKQSVSEPIAERSRSLSQQSGQQSTATERTAEASASSSSAAQTANPGSQPPPWTFTRLLKKRKTLPKRMGHMLQVLEDEKVQAALAEKKLPSFKAGDILEVRLAVPENKRRVAVAKGICIARRNRGLRTTFTIRNFLGTAGAVERTFPLFSPHIESISVLASRKVRRAKLYYLRKRQPREYRVA